MERIPSVIRASLTVNGTPCSGPRLIVLGYAYIREVLPSRLVPVALGAAVAGSSVSAIAALFLSAWCQRIAGLQRQRFPGGLGVPRRREPDRRQGARSPL
ncbi:MAG TPA: hypothetical protein VHC18_20480 [Amycolatopsis sp.]|nr:hypothetical protein [Amycolatopsis sp.]